MWRLTWELENTTTTAASKSFKHQYGLAFRWRDWLIASWGHVVEETTVAMYQIRGDESVGFYATHSTTSDIHIWRETLS